MCGLAGYWFTGGEWKIKEENSNEIIRNMLLLQKHRGPDDSGIVGVNTKLDIIEESYIENNCLFKEKVDLVLGFNRLSILDLTINGHQPMFSPDRRVMLMLNGEIYNAFEFKKELQAKGHSFKSTSDTEVLLHLYLEYGIELMLEKLNGMFALAIYDFSNKTLYLARDRCGIKPLYILKQNGRIAFTSEIKSFKALSGFKLKLNKTKIDEFLLFRYVVNNTLFEEIECCQPGTFWEIKAHGKSSVRKYYDVNNEGKTELESPYLLSHLKSTLESSVVSQMISDVKLGCQLSGGIDSSIVTYYASLHSKTEHLETISIIFKDPRFSEKTWIDEVVATLNLKDHQYILEGDFFYKILENAIWHFEHPISHANALGIYLLSSKAKKHVTVLLSGEGADEIFGGYHKFTEPSINRKAYIKHAIKQALHNTDNTLDFDIDFFLNCTDDETSFILTSAFVSLKTAKEIYPKFSTRNALRDRKKIMKSLTGPKFLRQRKYEIKSYLPELLLRQDKMSMAHSIENRVPFLDNNLVTLALKLPEGNLLKMHETSDGLKKRETKFMLKGLASEIFSEKFAFRKKIGLMIPEVEFMSTETFKNLWYSSIKPGIIERGIFNILSFDKLIEHPENANSEELTTIFLMMCFEIWAKQYLD